MTEGYTKLFSSIIASTIWREDNATRIVWITMLAMRNSHNIVEAAVPGLADMARVKVDECRKAIRKLEAPDRDSRTKEHGGRRILKVDGGWFIVNGDKYRRKMSLDDRREYKRQKQAEYRERDRQKAVQSVDNPVDTCVQSGHSKSKSKSNRARARPSGGAGGKRVDTQIRCGEVPTDEEVSRMTEAERTAWVRAEALRRRGLQA